MLQSLWLLLDEQLVVVSTQTSHGNGDSHPVDLLWLWTPKAYFACRESDRYIQPFGPLLSHIAEDQSLVLASVFAVFHRVLDR